jgi:hypothetical protein
MGLLRDLGSALRQFLAQLLDLVSGFQKKLLKLGYVRLLPAPLVQPVNNIHHGVFS